MIPLRCSRVSGQSGAGEESNNLKPSAYRENKDLGKRLILQVCDVLISEEVDAEGLILVCLISCVEFNLTVLKTSENSDQ